MDDYILYYYIITFCIINIISFIIHNYEEYILTLVKYKALLANFI